MSSSRAFLTQFPDEERQNEKIREELRDLEQLLAVAGQHTSQSTKLLKMKKEMREVDETLEKMKADFRLRMDECERRAGRFTAKQEGLAEQVARFEKFIKENESKRLRAEAKVKAEHHIFEEKQNESNALLSQIHDLEKEQSILNNDLDKIIMYKYYLEKILEDGEFGYEEIAEILARYATLAQSNKDLLGHSEKLEAHVDTVRKKLASLQTEKQNQILVSTSLLQEYQSDLERTRTQLKSLEEKKLQGTEKSKNVSREFSQVIQTIHNLYGRCLTSMGNKPAFVNNRPVGGTPSETLSALLDVELDLVCNRIVDLVEICDDYRRHLREEREQQAIGTTVSTASLYENSSTSMVETSNRRR